MFFLKEIYSLPQVKQEEENILFQSKYPLYFYEVHLTDHKKYFISSSYEKKHFIYLKNGSDHLFCGGEYFVVFSSRGKIITYLKSYERINECLLRGNSIFIFTERTSLEFSKYDYSVSNMSWYPDLIEEIVNKQGALKIKCLEGSITELKIVGSEIEWEHQSRWEPVSVSVRGV